jgi:hypothetical protein
MDHMRSRSFPGFGCLLALLTLWFVPYGLYILTIAVVLLLLSAAAQWIVRVLSSSASQATEGDLRRHS